MTGVTPSIGHRRLRRPSSSDGTFENSVVGGEVLDRGLTFEQLEKLCERNADVADLLHDQPEVAAKLRVCCKHIRQRDDDTWVVDYRCRQPRICGICQTIYGQIAREYFEYNTIQFERALGAPLRLDSFVTHLKLSKQSSPVDRFSHYLRVIDKFGTLARRGRIRTNNKNDPNRQLGPFMLSSHVEPETVANTPAGRFVRHSRVHLHTLVTPAKAFPVKELRGLIEKWWNIAVERTPMVADYELRKEQKTSVGREHLSNLIAYTARPMKHRTSPAQAVDMYRQVAHLPPSQLLRFLGCKGVRHQVPRGRLIGKPDWEFNQKELRYVRVG